MRKTFSPFVFIILFFLVVQTQFAWPRSSVPAKTLSNPFVAVFVDDATEATLGPFPYERSKYAQVVMNLHKAKAKAVVIKFFLDQAKPGPGDDQLAAAIKTLPVLLQARLDPTESHPNPYPSRFDRSSLILGDKNGLLSSTSGWIPLEKFSQNAVDVGFVDLASKKDILNIPMLLNYQGMLVPSLELAALELAFGKTAQIQLGGNITLTSHSLPLDSKSQIQTRLPDKDQIDSISFIDLFNGKFDKKQIKGKIVILGFDAKETPTLPTALGPIRIHRLFFYALENLYEQLKAH